MMDQLNYIRFLKVYNCPCWRSLTSSWRRGCTPTVSTPICTLVLRWTSSSIFTGLYQIQRGTRLMTKMPYSLSTVIPGYLRCNTGLILYFFELCRQSLATASQLLHFDTRYCPTLHVILQLAINVTGWMGDIGGLLLTRSERNSATTVFKRPTSSPRIF